MIFFASARRASCSLCLTLPGASVKIARSSPAGHTPGLLRDGAGVIELPATGLPLGLFSHVISEASIVALGPGDALVLVSRGIVEAKRRTKEFGLDQVKDNLQRTQTQTATEICTAILDRVQEFTGKPPKHNDVTVLALARHLQ